MTKITGIVTQKYPNPNFTTSHRKESAFLKSWTLFALIDGQIENVCEVRFYGKHTGRVSACVWGKANGIDFAASAMTQGYGYDKTEEAGKLAFLRAGFQIEDAYKFAHEPDAILMALAEYLGLTVFHVHNAHP